ncbi:hypothetical protein [Halobacillus aidingensis]|uniref:Fur-regulated basic protein A n=1 Tax=Halobacillus aidingensis TaxID=240303 RepID=A0A1H0MHM6_HALAD|nr:hypothetical protein [Halobacillus aidingensis]SDO79825.1 hypothetical protein SAMN05421677_10839 [Halobacillus aidingensis]
MTDHERNELIALLAWQKGWLPEAFERMSDEELIAYNERING